MNWSVFLLVFCFFVGITGSAFLYHLMSSFVKLSGRSRTDSTQGRSFRVALSLAVLWLGWTSLWVSGVISQIIILKGEL